MYAETSCAGHHIYVSTQLPLEPHAYNCFVKTIKYPHHLKQEHFADNLMQGKPIKTVHD